METLSTYDQQALDFLTATNTTIKAEFIKNGKHFDNDKEDRDIYKITLLRGGRSYTFNFGQSIHRSGRFVATYGNKTLMWDKFPQYGKDPLLNKHYLKPSEIKHNPNFEEPTAYSVLACLQKYDVGTLDDFISEFGYEFSNSKEYKQVEKTYNAVVDEFNNVQKLWNEEELEILRDIQ